MRYGVAMYRGGMIVDALDCDSDSCRQLGIICPYCSEALFLRSGSRFLRGKGTEQEKMVKVPQVLSHYADRGGGQSCELRSKTSQGKQDLERLAQKAQGQRLDLYNRHLWEMFSADRNMSRDAVQNIRKAFGDRWIEEMAKKVQKAFARQIEASISTVTQYVTDMATAISEDFRREIEEFGKLAPDYMLEDVIQQSTYFSQVDAKIHIQVCSEIIHFLGTRTAKYAFRQIFTCWLQQSSLAIAQFIQQEYPPEQLRAMQASGQLGKLMIQKTKQVTPDAFCEGMAMTIAGTHWMEQIQGRLGK